MALDPMPYGAPSRDDKDIQSALEEFTLGNGYLTEPYEVQKAKITDPVLDPWVDDV